MQVGSNVSTYISVLGTKLVLALVVTVGTVITVLKGPERNARLRPATGGVVWRRSTKFLSERKALFST